MFSKLDDDAWAVLLTKQYEAYPTSGRCFRMGPNQRYRRCGMA